MNRNELVDAVAGRVGDRATAAAAVEAVLTTVVRAVHDGERVALSGFGVFEKADRAARTARNPSTGGTVDLPATSVPRFRAGQAFKDVVSGARPVPDAPPAFVPRARAARPSAAPAPAVAAAAVAPVVPEPAPAPPPAAAKGTPKAGTGKAKPAKGADKSKDKPKAKAKKGKGK